MDEVFKHLVIQLILEYANLEVFPHLFNDIQVNGTRALFELIWDYYWYDINKEVDPQMFENFMTEPDIEGMTDVTEKKKKGKKKKFKSENSG